MGLKKNSSATAAPVQAAAPAATAPAATTPLESGTSAAIDRLKKSSTSAAPKTDTAKGCAPRDYAEEARGKTRCVQFEAALMSPAIAGMKFDTMDQYLALCKQAADFGTAYTFGD